LIGALALIVQLILAPANVAVASPKSAALAELSALSGQSVVLCTHDAGDQPDAPAHSHCDGSGFCCHLGHAIAAIFVPPALTLGSAWGLLPRPLPPAEIDLHQAERAQCALPRGPPATV
jgi:hypothetical protein